MSEYQPVRTMAELGLLDSDEIVEGYRAGLDAPFGTPEPGSDKSRSYWHGWRNARVDRGFAAHDGAQRQLAREYVGTYKGLN